MFYKMIEKKCNEWYASDFCTIKHLLEYIEKTAQMRDAQISAIKTYLFLKIKCECKSLETLFKTGVFNGFNLDDAEISKNARAYLTKNKAAAALFEYACLKNTKGEQVSKELEKQIKNAPESIDYDNFFKDAFYGVSYTDYLFSLPMGAGKTFLMAAFIYLDLYFAMNEPHNKAFAHNFIIFAPSGLKSSVIPSLRTIQNFEPSWIIPEPAATTIKRMISFEVLDQSKTAGKSNKTKNPNVQKIAIHQPLSELFGLVAVTNAEKVILDRVKVDDKHAILIEKNDDEKDMQANELRNLIGKLPCLSIFIDEVHHAVNDDIKLRAVVNKWTENNTINSVIGFSGTPYLEKTEKLRVLDSLSVGTAEITNIVSYYPLIDGVGNFLKRPLVRIIDNADSANIIKKGVRDFLDEYKDTVYAGGLTAKLGIYCGSIEKAEEVVYPIVSSIAAEYGLNSNSILKFHKGNKEYPQPADSQLQFDILDKDISPIRIILLVQIGKEGWDCRSLTGIILSQEGDCPRNMVLQTSCRCLRQVVKGNIETALIYLNGANAEKLKTQLQMQHHISLKEFTQHNSKREPIKRYDRTEYLKLPKVDFYQLKILYDTLTIEKANPIENIPVSVNNTQTNGSIIKTTDFSMDESKTSIHVDKDEHGKEITTFNSWIYAIHKGGFGSPSIQNLLKHKKALKDIFDLITYVKNETRYFSSNYNRKQVEANIRKAFYDQRSFATKEELVPEEASLLNIANFTSEVYADKPNDYYPEQTIVEKIIKSDKGELKPDTVAESAIQMLEKSGVSANIEAAKIMRSQYFSHKNKDSSFHYLPYHTESRFEQTFLKEVLSLDEIEKLGLEVYYNGDRGMTDFKIKCYKKRNNNWSYIGFYTPDFLIIKRKENKIHKIIIVETKGQIYANDPTFIEKKKFTATEFAKQNNKAYGYERFDYLYLEDTLSAKERINATHKKICEFFEETI
ncbi:MAG: DEAD/DEAH box helicase family protein [Candidatus Riflebacteria bacterium]|nr:DEAD/DEAH box helicase family protein [Candidatus Riflebacteria bacterium]